MNTNVGDMPIEIFGDYVSDSLGVEFPWEMLTPMFNGENDIKNQRGSGWWYNYDYGHGDIYGTEGAWGDGQGEIGCGAGSFCVFFCDGIAQGNGH